MVSSSELSTQRLRKAGEMLDDAQWLLANGRSDSAADRAYYAMFHAAAATVTLDPHPLPRTDEGAYRALIRRLETSSDWPKGLATDLTDAFHLRQRSVDPRVSIGGQAAQDALAKARTFIETIRTLLKVDQ